MFRLPASYDSHAIRSAFLAETSSWGYPGLRYCSMVGLCWAFAEWTLRIASVVRTAIREVWWGRNISFSIEGSSSVTQGSSDACDRTVVLISGIPAVNAIGKIPVTDYIELGTRPDRVPDC